jgi:hypothetical protein
MNPPPIEKKVRSARSRRRVERREPHAVGMLHLCAGRKHLIAMKDQVARLVEGDLERFPAKLYAPAARMAATVDSMAAGSMVAGSFPARPRRTARSVAWPLPVRASEP